MASQQTAGPLELALRKKITESLQPIAFQVHNDSSKHSHHKAMVGNVSSETHFRLEVVSANFNGKPRVARHRMIYELLKDEIAAAGGIHALQLFLKTPDEANSQASHSRPVVDASVQDTTSTTNTADDAGGAVETNTDGR